MVDNNIVFGVQWLYSIGRHTIYYQFPKIKFQDAAGKEVALRGVNTYPKQVINAHSMRYLLIHGDIEWDVECFISTKGNTLEVAQYLKDIQKLIRKHKRVFGDLPHGRPPDRGVEHKIELEIGKSPIQVHPYKHPKIFKDEIERTIK